MTDSAELQANPEWMPEPPPRSVVVQALLIASRMQTLPELERRARRDSRGRKQRRSVLGSIASVLMTLKQVRKAQVTWVDKVQQGMDPWVQDALGIPRHGVPVRPRTPTGRKARYCKPQEGLGRQLDQLNRQLEASPFFGSYLTEEQRAENQRWQKRVYDDAVAGWLPRLPPPDLLTVDATGIRSYALPGKDPDFSWLHQTPTSRDPAARIYGAYGTVLSGVNLPGGMPYPAVALGFRLPLPPESHHANLTALDLLDAWLARGNPPTTVVTDALYTHHTDWSLDLARRGCGMIGDLQKQEAGRKDDGSVHGAVLIDAALHCPFGRYREDLPSPKQKGQALIDYQAANEYRSHFALQAVAETPGEITAICPAQALTVRCPLWPRSMQLGDRFPEVSDPPREARRLDVCRGPVTIPRTAKWIRKIWMPLYYGGEQWRAVWSLGRPRAEGIFGMLFGENMQHAVIGVTQWVGQARTGLVYALALALCNLRAIRTWWATPGLRESVPEPYLARLEQDPLLWPTDRQEVLLPVLLDRIVEHC